MNSNCNFTLDTLQKDILFNKLSNQYQKKKKKNNALNYIYLTIKQK